jgi:hypothetical protein
MIFDPPVYTLREFSRSHNLTPVTCHRLFHELGLKPRTVTIGKDQYITRESAIEWRRRVEEYAAQHGGRIEL